MATCKIANLAVLICLTGGGLAQTAGGHFSSQQMLDLLAKPIPVGSRMALLATFPTRYQDWTDAQRQAGLQMVTQRCGLMYALEGDNPNAHLLPETMTKTESAELAVSVCLPAKMPTDWPERKKYLSDAHRLITKANSLGAGLHLPEGLSVAN